MHWTDSQVDLLITLWTEGWSPDRIAARLSTLGHDSVLEKTHRLMLGRSPLRRVASKMRSAIAPCRISAGQHSDRFRSVLCEQARRRAERRAGEDDADARAARLARTIRTGDRQAGLLAALLALEQENRPPFQTQAAVLAGRRGTPFASV